MKWFRVFLLSKENITDDRSPREINGIYVAIIKVVQHTEKIDVQTKIGKLHIPSESTNAIRSYCEPRKCNNIDFH